MKNRNRNRKLRFDFKNLKMKIHFSNEFYGVIAVPTFAIIVSIVGFFQRNPIMNLWSTVLLIMSLIGIGIFIKFEKEN